MGLKFDSLSRATREWCVQLRPKAGKRLGLELSYQNKLRGAELEPTLASVGFLGTVVALDAVGHGFVVDPLDEFVPRRG